MDEILSYYRDSRQIKELNQWLQGKDGNVLHIAGTAGSSPALIASCGLADPDTNHVFILSDKESAAYFHNDLFNFSGRKDILFFPSSYKRSVQYIQKNADNIVQRTGVLKKLSHGEAGLVIITFPEALVEKTVSPGFLDENAFSVARGDKLSLSFLAEFLDDCRFQEVDYVFEPGQFSIRGSILDVFSFSAKEPFRIDFFGEEVDSIRTFQIENQLSLEKLEQATLIPDLGAVQAGSHGGSKDLIPFTAFFGGETVWWINDLAYVKDRMDNIFDRTGTGNEASEESTGIEEKDDYLIDGKRFTELLSGSRRIEFGHQVFFSPDQKLSFDTIPQPAFRKNFELLAEDFLLKQDAGYQIFILSDNQKQIDRILSIFEDIHTDIRINPVGTTLHEGFIDHESKICLYTDHQIFERYHRYQLQEHFTRKESITVRELTALHPGDYVVHIDHGIGQFGGLEKIRLNNREQEAVKLVFKDQDTLYVSIHSLHRISKYKGKDSEPPRIYKLGSGAWQKLKASTKKKVKDIARELINMYARRRTLKGFSFSPDSYLQTELEASFMYEDTEDQLKATRELKEGMEADFPMDRLVCGDVGFGKTEVAIRGGF